MIPKLGQVVKLNQEFMADVWSRGDPFDKWMRGAEADEYMIGELKRLNKRPDIAYSVLFVSMHTKKEYRISMMANGCHLGRTISNKPIFNFDYNQDDVCQECGIIGEITRMSCICRNCGKVIWGC